MVAKTGSVELARDPEGCALRAHLKRAEQGLDRLIKVKLLDGGRFPGMEEARLEVSQHIAYYNAERLYSPLGYLAPNHFEIQLRPRPSSVRFI